MNFSLTRRYSSIENRKDRLLQDLRGAAGATQEYVRENPWKSFGLPAVAALVVFVLLSRR